MIDRITIKEKGAVPRRFKAAHNAASKSAWYSTGLLFHTEMRDRRFTSEHGRKAGYKPRRGEEAGISGKAFWNSYTGQKLKKWHHRRPLEWSGGTRKAVRAAKISCTSTGAKVAYAGASKFNYRSKGSSINMAEEFRKIIPEEITQLARKYDQMLEAGFKSDNTTTIRQI
jgi:hypothetical protein